MFKFKVRLPTPEEKRKEEQEKKREIMAFGVQFGGSPLPRWSRFQVNINLVPVVSYQPSHRQPQAITSGANEAVAEKPQAPAKPRSRERAGGGGNASRAKRTAHQPRYPVSDIIQDLEKRIIMHRWRTMMWRKQMGAKCYTVKYNCYKPKIIIPEEKPPGISDEMWKQWVEAQKYYATHEVCNVKTVCKIPRDIYERIKNNPMEYGAISAMLDADELEPE